jgi:hypothetical protein
VERRKLQEEKEDLQKQLDSMKLERADETKERSKFYEGASWLGRQALTVSESSMKECDMLKMEYHRKLIEAADD